MGEQGWIPTEAGHQVGQIFVSLGIKWSDIGDYHALFQVCGRTSGTGQHLPPALLQPAWINPGSGAPDQQGAARGTHQAIFNLMFFNFIIGVIF